MADMVNSLDPKKGQDVFLNELSAIEQMARSVDTRARTGYSETYGDRSMPIPSVDDMVIQNKAVRSKASNSLRGVADAPKAGGIKILSVEE